MPRKKAEGEQGVEVSEVLERFDPDIDVDADGDPTFELKLAEAPEDKHFVYVHKEDVGKYKSQRYAPVKGGEVQLRSGEHFEDGEDVVQKEHLLMARDRGYHERRETAERKANRELRGRMIKTANKTVFVNNPGSPGR